MITSPVRLIRSLSDRRNRVMREIITDRFIVAMLNEAGSDEERLRIAGTTRQSRSWRRHRMAH